MRLMISDFYKELNTKIMADVNQRQLSKRNYPSHTSFYIVDFK